MKKEDSGRKKLLSAFLMLIITAIALTTASYAWFTENTTVSLAGLDVNVTASDGIQISLDATTWKAGLTTTDLTSATLSNTYAAHEDQIPGGLVPVSSVLTLTNGKLEMYKGLVTTNANNDYIITAARSYESGEGTCSDETIKTRTECVAATETWTSTGVRTTTGDFIAFDLFIQTNKAETLYLTSGSDVVTSGTDLGLKQSARVAFVYLGSAAAGSTAATAQTITSSAGSVTKLWEPNSNLHNATAITHALQNYQQTITGAQVLASYSGIKAPITSAANILLRNSTAAANGTLFGTVTPDIQTNVTNAVDSALFSFAAAGVHKVRVYAWIEGQDYDCENAASGSAVTFNIQLSKNHA